MPEQPLLRIIKRWRRYEPKGAWSRVPKRIRGVYVLYREKVNRRTAAWPPGKQYEVLYIGIAGTGTRLKLLDSRASKDHARKRHDWTHFSVLEVHDNVTREEISELESLLLAIFRHDPRIVLENKQHGSSKLSELRKDHQWAVT